MTLPRLAPLLLALAAILTGAACRGSSDARAPATAARRYTIRAEVLKLPEAGGPRQLMLRHEAIKDFANAQGAVVGMNAMTMPFEVAPAVSLDGLAPGDKVEAVFAVDWALPSMQIEQLRKLPADTVLRFEKAGPGEPARP